MSLPPRLTERRSLFPNLTRTLAEELGQRPPMPGAPGIGDNSASFGQRFDCLVSRTCSLPAGYLSDAEKQARLILPISPMTQCRVAQLGEAVGRERAQRPLSRGQVNALLNSAGTFDLWGRHFHDQLAHYDVFDLPVRERAAEQTTAAISDLEQLRLPFSRIASAIGRDLQMIAERGNRR